MCDSRSSVEGPGVLSYVVLSVTQVAVRMWARRPPRRDGVGERGAVPRRAKRHFIGSEEAEAGKRDVLAAMR